MCVPQGPLDSHPGWSAGAGQGRGQCAVCPCHAPTHPRLLPQEFIEELLAPGFGGMIAFVKEAEALAERGQLERLRGEEGEWRLRAGGMETWGGGVAAPALIAALPFPALPPQHG